MIKAGAVITFIIIPEKDMIKTPMASIIYILISFSANFIENVARKLHLNLDFDLGGEKVLQSSPLFPFFSIFS